MYILAKLQKNKENIRGNNVYQKEALKRAKDNDILHQFTPNEAF